MRDLRGTLFLFDIDDTLLKTDSKIVLRNKANPKKIERKLSTEEYRTWKELGELNDYVVSYEEFNDPVLIVQSLSNGKPRKGIEILADVLDQEDIEVGILTARSGSERAIRKGLLIFLKKQGLSIDLDPSLVFAVNNKEYGLSGTDSEKKLSIILKLIKENIFDRIFLVDDDPMHKEIIDKYCKKNKITTVEVIPV